MKHLCVVLAGLLACLGSCVAGAATVEPTGTWRFRQDDRTDKVIVIGGSIAARLRGSFSQDLAGRCDNIDLVNKARTGAGALALKRRFRAQLLRNPNVPLKDPRFRYWLLYSGGLNSVHAPKSTIEHTAALFRDAHRAGVKVVALTVTPWGDSADARWRGWEALTQLRNTRAVVDYITGLSAPDTPADVRPVVVVDVFDSALRDKDAPLWKADALARQYDGSRALQRRYPDKQAAIEQLRQAPRWWLRRDLRSFDHIHPNVAGHARIAQTVCPHLPRSWGCRCSD